MSINRIKSDILSILLDNKTYIKTKDLLFKLSGHELTPRTFQNEIKELINTNRVGVSGKASLTSYILQEIQRSYPSSQFLYVCKDNLTIGLLFKVKGIYRFYYASEYLAKYDIGIPTIPLQIEPIDFEKIPAVFEDNFPEGINREIFETTHKTADEFEILPLLEDSVGDLCFTRTKEQCKLSEKKGIGYLSSIDEILGKNKLIEVLDDYTIELSDDELFPETKDLSSLNTLRTEGISGFQYKRFVNIDTENKRIIHSDGAGEYILKPYSVLKADEHSEYYFPHIAVNEHLHISFAKNALGFNAPYSAIVKRENDKEFHYIIKRFDRFHHTRYAKATFGVFLGLRTENKYDTTSEKMFKRISKELLSKTERMNLLKYYFYSVLIVHEDMHTKNLSLIFDDKKVLLAPIYDISATGFYHGVKGYESYLTINGKRNNIRPNDFKPLCKILNIDFKNFKVEALSMAEKYRDVMPEYFEEVEKLGSIPFFEKKDKRSHGESEKVKTVVGEQKEFVDVLRAFHTSRVKELLELGWLV